MTETMKQRRPPTYDEVLAAQLLVERFERGVAPEPGADIRELAEMPAGEAAMDETTRRPTYAEVLAAQLLVERFERGVAPEPGERIRRLAKMTLRPDRVKQ